MPLAKRCSKKDYIFKTGASVNSMIKSVKMTPKLSIQLSNIDDKI